MNDAIKNKRGYLVTEHDSTRCGSTQTFRMALIKDGYLHQPKLNIVKPIGQKHFILKLIHCPSVE